MKQPSDIRLIAANGQWCSPAVFGQLAKTPGVLLLEQRETDSYLDRVARLRGLVEEHPKATVLGYSMGALVATHVSSQINIRRLILSNPTPLPGQRLGKEVTKAMEKYALPTLCGARFIVDRGDAEKFFFNVCGNASDKNFKMLVSDSGALVRRLALNQFLNYRLMDHIPRRGTEVHVCYGNMDVEFPPESVHLVVEALRREGTGITVAEWRYAGDHGHVPWIEPGSEEVVAKVLRLAGMDYAMA